MKNAIKNFAQARRATDGKPGESTKLVFFLFALIGGGGVFLLSPSLSPSFMISGLFFFVLSPLIDSLERKNISRAHAIGGIFLIMALVFGGLGVWFTPTISNEVTSFQSRSKEYSQFIEKRLKIQEAELASKISFLKDAQLTEKTLDWLSHSGEKIWTFIPNIASHVMMMLFLVPLLTFFFLSEGHKVRRALLKLVPNKHFETVYSLMYRILDEMGGFVSARIIESILVSAIVTVCCLIAGIPFAFLLGIFAGATNPIPYLGPVIGAVPGILLAILEPSGPNHLFWITMIYVMANVIDTVVIFPVLVARIVNLHPLIVILAVMLGSQWFGILGMILAVPITSIIKILVQEIYSRVYNHAKELNF
jgi:putative permease